MDSAALRSVRSFNRTVGQTLGIVDDRFLGRRRPPGESRVLWEIGELGADLRALRSRLDLDSGYVTRVMRSLERQGLVRVRAGRDDRRVRRAILTARGRAERALLERRSDAHAERILASVPDAHRAALVRAMADVDRLLRMSMVTFAVESPRSPDATRCLRQYVEELNERFEHGFDPSLSISADARALTPPARVFVDARASGEPVGCGALKFHGAKPAELKRMWISRRVRGFGVGARLLTDLERRAREAGVGVIRLETNRALTEAIALYRRSGYREVKPFNSEPYAHHWFEKKLQ